MRTRGSGAAGRPAQPGQDLADRARLAVLRPRAPRRAPGRSRRPRRRARPRRCRRTSCRSALPRSRDRQPAAAGRAATIRATSWVSPGPQTRCGRTTSTARDRPIRGRAPSARPRPWSGSSGPGLAPGPPAPPLLRDSGTPACATDGDETCTSRRTPAAAQAADDVCGCPRCWPARTPRHGPDDVHLGGQVHHGVLPLRPPGGRRSRSATSPSTSAARQAARPALQHRHLVAPCAAAAARCPAQHPGGAGDQHPHVARCREPRAGEDAGGPARDLASVDLRRVPDVERQPVGDEHRRDRAPAAPRTASASSPGASDSRSSPQRRPGTDVPPADRSIGHDDDHDDLGAGRADADRRGGGDAVHGLDPLLDPDRRHDARRRR